MGEDHQLGGILHVCTGNQARSPIAERLMELGLRRRFGAAADAIYVTSAGTRGPAGSPMQRMAVAELERRAARHDNFVSQLLDLKAVERAHLVLTATRQHRDEIISQVPSAIRHTFTWRELAWLASGLKPGEVPGRYPLDRVARLAWVVTKRRGYLSPPPPEQFDIADPMGRPKQHYRVAAAQIEEAIESILDVL